MANKQDFIKQLAVQVWNGTLRLGTIRDTFGSDIASQVYELRSKVTKSNWIRRIR